LLKYAKEHQVTIHENRSPTTDNWISGSAGRRGFSFTSFARQQDSQVELWIGHGAGEAARNKAAFDALIQQRAAIEQQFGSSMEWQRLDEGAGCRVRFVIDGGYRSPASEWPNIFARLVDAMRRLDAAMRQRIRDLTY
jgi:hypothetical protein